MVTNSSAAQKKATAEVFRSMPQKVGKLVTKAVYEAPKVISFPIDGMKISEALTGMGNAG